MNKYDLGLVASLLVTIIFLVMTGFTVENKQDIRQASVACITANGVMEVQNDVFICTKVDANINSNN